jgi:two-component system NarL family sensor kinase
MNLEEMTAREPHESDAEILARRNRELSILNRIAEALNRSLDLDEALRAVLAQVAELLGLRTGWIWLLRDETDESYLAAAQNLPSGLAQRPEKMEGSCYCLDTYRAGDLSGAANINVVTCSRLRAIVDGTDGLRYHASIPLYAQSRRLGVLNVASPDWRELSAEDLRLLHTIGDLLSIAIERARLFARSAQVGTVEERNRLAREIHDTLAQGLAAVVLRLETAAALLDAGADASRLRETIEQTLGLTRATLEEARRSVLDLRAAPLEGRTLGEALKELAEGTTAMRGPGVQFEVVGATHPLPVRVEAGLYRIAQEALANVVRHARARSVRLRLEVSPEWARLSIVDDGQGFDPAQVSRDHYGLVGLAERAKLLGGRLDLQSSPGEGTRIEVEIPLRSPS